MKWFVNGLVISYSFGICRSEEITMAKQSSEVAIEELKKTLRLINYF